MTGVVAENPLREGIDERREPVPVTLVILGATGDLAHRKLFPALYNLAYEGLLHPDSRVVGLSRRDWSPDAFRKEMQQAVDEHSRRSPVEPEVWEQLTREIDYVAGTFDDDDCWARLKEVLQAIDTKRNHPGCHLYYLATPPSTYHTIVSSLGKAGLVRAPADEGDSRIVVEKPFGRDLETAKDLNRALHAVFDESQIYRIDHYLGKETVQNILVFRLDNGIFEPLWNGRHVDHVQITVAESVGVGSRAGYYEEAGALRDMLQNHMMQLLSLVCMEPPVRFEAKSVRDEKVKVLRAIRVPAPDEVGRRVVRGQYTAGTVGGKEVVGYLEEKGVADDSRTETFLAAKFQVENWRWGSTPFYLRTGKCLPKRSTEIAIVFRTPPYEVFEGRPGSRARPNVLRLRIQPEEGISLSFESKTPGQTMHIEEVRMDFSYSTSFGEQSPEAYERLLLDAIQGDSTLFAREDEVQLSWGLVDAIAAAWNERPDARPHAYEAGTWGPVEAERLIQADGRRWLSV